MEYIREISFGFHAWLIKKPENWVRVPVPLRLISLYVDWWIYMQIRTKSKHEFNHIFSRIKTASTTDIFLVSETRYGRVIIHYRMTCFQMSEWHNYPKFHRSVWRKSLEYSVNKLSYEVSRGFLLCTENRIHIWCYSVLNLYKNILFNLLNEVKIDENIESWKI